MWLVHAETVKLRAEIKIPKNEKNTKKFVLSLLRNAEMTDVKKLQNNLKLSFYWNKVIQSIISKLIKFCNLILFLLLGAATIALSVSVEADAVALTRPVTRQGAAVGHGAARDCHCCQNLTLKLSFLNETPSNLPTATIAKTSKRTTDNFSKAITQFFQKRIFIQSYSKTFLQFFNDWHRLLYKLTIATPSIVKSIASLQTSTSYLKACCLPKEFYCFYD